MRNWPGLSATSLLLLVSCGSIDGSSLRIRSGYIVDLKIKAHTEEAVAERSNCFVIVRADPDMCRADK